MNKRKVLFLDPDLGDGCCMFLHTLDCQIDKDSLIELIECWMENCVSGESIEIEMREMTDEDIEALPEN